MRAVAKRRKKQKRGYFLKRETLLPITARAKTAIRIPVPRNPNHVIVDVHDNVALGIKVGHIAG